MKIEKDELYLVTGGSGFLGTSLIKRIISEGGRVRVVARNEGKLIELKQKFNDIEIITGDIVDEFIVRKCVVGVTGVFHLAAFKHVGLAEKQPIQCINTNVTGTLNLLRACNPFLSGIEFFLSISTDKAAQVAGVYGASKLLMERMIKEYEQSTNAIQYRIVRYGNVLYSTGSVLCKWKQLMQEGKKVLVTDLDATRFYWTVDEAISLIFDCLEKAKDSTPYCPTMKATKIEDLLNAMYLKYGKGNYDDGRVIFETIGLQPGENMHEKVLDDGPYSNEVEQYTEEELIKMI